MIQNGNKTTLGMLGSNVHMVSFKLASSQEVFFAGASEKGQLISILRPKKGQHTLGFLVLLY